MLFGVVFLGEIVEIMKRILLFGVVILNGYGMSEIILIFLCEICYDKGVSVGKLVVGVLICVVDEQFKDVELGIDGECIVKGFIVFMGYKDNLIEI